MDLENEIYGQIILDQDNKNQVQQQQSFNDNYDLMYRPSSITLYEDNKIEEDQDDDNVKNADHLKPWIVTIKQKMETQEVATQHEKFDKKVAKTEKYEIKRYEITLLVQIVRNEDNINFLEEKRIYDIFKKLLYQIDDRIVYSLAKSNIKYDPTRQNPYQVQFLVDFISRINCPTFQKNPHPVNYQDVGPNDNPANIRYIVDYFLTMNQQYNRYPQDFEDLALLGEGCFGVVKLVKYLRDNNIYALKIMKLGQQAINAIKTMNQYAKNPLDKNNIVREVLFLQRMNVIFKLQHPNIIKLEKYWLQEQEQKFYILLQYFGGTKYESNSIFDFFHPKSFTERPQHIDLGQQHCKEVVAQIFYQAVQAIKFIHQRGIVHRDIKDDNFLIKRMCGCIYKKDQKEYNIPYVFQIALCDFGMSGFIDRTQSLISYDSNDFRDKMNIKQYPAACDIYSLGVLLERLIQLYNVKLKNYTSLIQIKNDFQEIMQYEYKLSQRMKCEIHNRPKTIQALEETDEFKQWLQSIPKYIPIYFDPSQ